MSDSTPTKRCSKCGVENPATIQYFPPRSDSPSGLRNHCRLCTNARGSKYKRDHRKNILRSDQKYRATHAEQIREYHRAYAKAHPERGAKASHKWHVKYPDRSLARKRRYLSAHPEKPVEYYHKRRARRLLAPSTFVQSDWRHALDYFGHSCAVCGRPQGLWHKLARDHWIPVTGGGGYTPDNIVPLCHGLDGCNNSKNNKPPLEWLISRYGKRKATIILARIETYFNSLKEDKS